MKRLSRNCCRSWDWAREDSISMRAWGRGEGLYLSRVWAGGNCISGGGEGPRWTAFGKRGCDFGRGEGESCHRLTRKDHLQTNKGYYSLVLRVDHGWVIPAERIANAYRIQLTPRSSSPAPGSETVPSFVFQLVLYGEVSVKARREPQPWE